MINGFEELNKFQSYIGKEIWIYIPGFGPDMYNGTAECSDPYIDKVIADGIKIGSRSVELRYYYPDCDDEYYSKNIKECFLTKEEAETYMNNKIKDGTAWL